MSIDSLRDYAVLDGERLQSLWDEIDRLRASTACKHEHGSGILDTNGNGEFTCHDCGHVQKSGRGLPPQPEGKSS